MDMATVARHGLFRNMEVGFDEHVPCDIRRISIQYIPGLEGFTRRILDIVGTIAKRDDVHAYVLPQSELWIVEEMLRLFTTTTGTTKRFGYDVGRTRHEDEAKQSRRG